MVNAKKEKSKTKKAVKVTVKAKAVKSADLKTVKKKTVIKSAQKAPKAITAKVKKIHPKPEVIVAKPIVQKKPELQHKPIVHDKPIAQHKPVVPELPLVHHKPVMHEKPVVIPEAKVEPKLIVIPKPPAAVTQPKPIEIPKPTQPEIKKEALEPSATILSKEVELEIPITVKDLSVKLQEKSSLLIKALMDMKIMVTLNQALDESLAVKICEKFGYKIKKAASQEEAALLQHQKPDLAAELKHRSPIVTIMGHVDHGKTSLLDAIRKSKVVDAEHGGITQHIGAYRVVLPKGEITFLDTPGHEAFTAMRSRGAKITDIVVLVVAADDGIMPQTIESIDHARAAGVSIIVAVNKIDKAAADPDRVKKQLAEHDLMAEDWGGKTITVPVSAKTGQGIDTLLEMILLEAEMLELKANPNRLAKGVVIEAKISKGRGPVATLLVQNGTLHLNDNIIAGNFYGKIRAMFNDRAQAVTKAGPGFPVEVLGISGIPEAGEQFFVIADEKQAKELAEMRQEKDRLHDIKVLKKISLEDLHAQILAGKIKELKIIIKADVQGSLEAIRQTLAKLDVSEIKIIIIHEGVGSINSSDVLLAAASDALIVGFNVMPDVLAKDLIAKEGVDVKTYNIIYELANEIKAAVEGMLAPKLKKVFLGKVEVRKVFRLSRSGVVAGCFVSKGKIMRSNEIAVTRNGEHVFEGKIHALKRFKDDVREVAEGFECGISINGFDAIQEGDVIEAFEIQKIARTL